MRRHGAKLCVTISDDGIPFDPLSAAMPNMELPLEEREIAGLGIHLVRNLVHSAQYRRQDGRNIVTFIQELE
jgi:anti-sigma regulatory factor (Ser/Thr protein kinase)